MFSAWQRAILFFNSEKEIKSIKSHKFSLIKKHIFNEKMT